MTTLVRVRIIHDDSPESPREWGNVGTFVGFEHRSYNIGDRRPTQGEITALEYGGWAGLVRHLERQYGATRVLPVGMLDHSGVTYYVGGGAHWSDAHGWDSGTCGYIFDTAEGRERTGAEPGEHEGEINVGYLRGKVRGMVDNIMAALTSEIETYAQWASGDVYGVIVERRTLCELCAATDDVPDDCPHCTIEDDACFGYYGLDVDANGMADGLDADAIEALRAEADAYHVEYDGRVLATWREVA